MSLNLTRHNTIIRDILPDLNRTMHIIGCGSIGTAVATLLTRIGFDAFVLWDKDIVEEHNIANQYFDEIDIGYPKSDALMTKIARINNDVRVDAKKRNFTHECIKDITSTDIIVICVDNMNSRRNIYEAIYNSDKKQDLYILDGRMGLHDGIVLCFKCDLLNACAKYEETLYSDEESAPQSCTAKTVLYTVNVIAGVMTRRLLMALGGKIEYSHDILSMEEPQIINITTLSKENDTHALS